MLKRRTWMRKCLALAVALCMSLSLAGCGNDAGSESSSASDSVAGSTSSAAESSASAEAATGEKTTVAVGIGNAFSPFCYLDENEELAGYDYEVMLAVADLLSDDYEFVFTADEFSNLLIGLDTGAYDIAVHHFGYTAERAENYLYAGEADFYFGAFHIGYAKDRTDITDLESLDGMTLVLSSGSMAETLVLNYLEEHPELNISLEYTSDEDVMHSGLVNGLYDATVMTEYDLDNFSSKYDDFLTYSDYKIPNNSGSNTGTYFVYSKGSETLQTAIDDALVTLRENGTLAELSEKLLGGDYTEPPA